MGESEQFDRDATLAGVTHSLTSCDEMVCDEVLEKVDDNFFTLAYFRDFHDEPEESRDNRNLVCTRTLNILFAREYVPPSAPVLLFDILEATFWKNICLQL